MHFSASFLAAALPLLAAGAPASVPSSGPIGLIATHSASPIHLSSVNAAGQNFWIGKETSTYCPLTPASSCPPGKDTIISVTGDQAHPGGASMYVVVPGGQQMFIRSNGALGYTQAHSAAIPSGAITTGFTFAPASAGTDFGTFGVNLPGAAGLLACPAGPDFTAPYQVFVNLKGLKDADVAGGKISKCIGFNAIAPKASGANAWQYT
ncbi:hypothetical protein MMC07_006670 [Pseudocyphellaria aurata]|nr:hypothetical protein [Pseudocyphellaria aurata]